MTKRLAFAAKTSKSIPIIALKPVEMKKGAGLAPGIRKWAKANGYEAGKGKLLPLPSAGNDLTGILFGLGNDPNPLDLGTLPGSLPEGAYHLEASLERTDLATLGWLLGSYRFDRYRKSRKRMPRLVPPSRVDTKDILRQAEAVFLARDLINTPANDMGPDELEKAIRVVAKKYHARVTVIKGEKLLASNFPLVHAVGRASTRAPRLIDLKWGKASDPRITLVGKGVVFDTGGLNLKPGNSMALMKKDMGGAANVLALAQLIMDANLPVRLRLLIPAVENSVSGNAFRPGDILDSRKGISVEIGNTDAEGRLVLADALTLAEEEKPELLVDMATLTGAARVALGPDLPPFYTESDKLAEKLMEESADLYDPLWRMPLWKPYNKMLSSKVADVNHISPGGYAGSVTAALFLSRFIENPSNWIHLDIFGWVPSRKPWATEGGEAQGIRALYAMIRKKFC